MRKRDTLSLLALSFGILIICGLALYFITGRDLYLRLGVVVAAAAALVWVLLHCAMIIRNELRAGKYLSAVIGGAMHVGGVLLLIYFTWFLLWEMLRVQMVGPVPPPKTSKLTIIGALLIISGTVAAFVAAAFSHFRKRPRD